MKLRAASIAVISALAWGCGGPEFQLVTVSVRAPDRDGQVVPIVGADLTLLPFDIDSVYTALEERNQAGPKPSTDALEVLFQTFFTADTALIGADSLLVQRQAALEGLTDRTTPEYRAAFNAYQQAQERRDSIAAARDSAEARFAPAREAYNRARSTWEASAWDGFNETNEERYQQVQAPQDTAGAELAFKHKTGEDGTFRVSLAPGRWWVAGRAGVPGSTRQLYRWNVAFTVGEEAVTVELTGENAELLNAY